MNYRLVPAPVLWCLDSWNKFRSIKFWSLLRKLFRAVARNIYTPRPRTISMHIDRMQLTRLLADYARSWLHSRPCKGVQTFNCIFNVSFFEDRWHKFKKHLKKNKKTQETWKIQPIIQKWKNSRTKDITTRMGTLPVREWSLIVKDVHFRSANLWWKPYLRTGSHTVVWNAILDSQNSSFHYRMPNFPHWGFRMRRIRMWTQILDLVAPPLTVDIGYITQDCNYLSVKCCTWFSEL